MKGGGDTAKPANSAGKLKRDRRSFGPYKFEPKAAREIIKSIKIGCWLEVASSCAGVARKTVYNWLRRGKRGESEDLAKFFREYKRARHLSGRLHVQWVFAAASNGNTEASKWFLERRYPKQFGKREKIEHLGPGGGPMQTADVTNMTTGERKARLQELTAMARARAAALEKLQRQMDGEADGEDDGKDDDPEGD